MSIFVLLPLMNEYGVCPLDDSWCEGGVQHVQLAYAPYAALRVFFEVTSLLAVGMRSEGNLGYAILNC